MLTLHRVVHPTDFSDGARAAFAHAIHLARKHGATLDVIHTAPLLGDLPPGPALGLAFYPEGYEDQFCVDQETALRAYVGEADTAGVALHVVPPLFGSPAAWEILNYAHGVGADLIVMGTHGRHGLKRLLLGSVAEVVVRRAACPVLTVQAKPAGADRPEHVRCILAAVDLTYHAEDVLRYAGAFATIYGAALVLLHVVDGVTSPEVARLGLERRGRRLVQLEAEALRRLEELRLLVTDPATPVTCHVSSGFTLDEVPAAIERIAPDLVVLASHGFKRFDRMLMGSIAERVVRLGQGATLMVKPAGKSLLPCPVVVGASSAVAPAATAPKAAV